ncbi:MAG TPA: M42 family metallopeptidase [bacterium]|nr:M42 family metallopeptidase [bacterium]
MEEKAFEFLKSFLNIPSPSGFEQPAQKFFAEYVRDCVDKIEMDVHSNVIATKNTEGKPKLMLAAHCDEIGLMVNYVTEDGFIYFVPIGGVSPYRLEGMRVFIYGPKGRVPGVIARKPIGLRAENHQEKPARFQDLWIDIGARDKKDVLSVVNIGDPITIAAEFQQLRNNCITARGLDDRLGVFVLAETMRRLKNEKIEPAVFAVSTVQEEVGSRGVWGVAYRLKPDVAIVVEVEHASDHPDTEKQVMGEVFLGKGIGFNRGSNINHHLNTMLIETAEKENVPYHITAVPGPTPTDASVIHIIREGVPCSVLRIPLRYMHTPSEIVSLDDVESAIKLLASFIRRLDVSRKFIMM